MQGLSQVDPRANEADERLFQQFVFHIAKRCGKRRTRYLKQQSRPMAVSSS